MSLTYACESSMLFQRCVTKLVNHCIRCKTDKYLQRQTKHLQSVTPYKGDPCPELRPNLLRLYSMRWCPFAQRTRLVLAHKQIEHEVVNINLSNKPPWLFEINRNGTVPVLELWELDVESTDVKNHKELIVGSLECCEYLENKYPETPKVLQKESDAKTLTLLNIFKQVEKDMQAYIIDKIEGEGGGTPEDYITKQMSKLEQRFTPDSIYAEGSQVSITDFLLWPRFERIIAKGYKVDSSKLPNLSRWVNNMSNLQAVINTRNSTEDYMKHWSLQKSNRPSFDL